MIKALIVGVGGFCGATLRYLIGLLAHRLSGGHWFPHGTLTVNVVGCFLIGLIVALGESKGFLSHNLHLFLVIGLLGGFTTFSSFGHETAVLFRNAQTGAVFLNVFLHFFLCFIAVFIGHELGKVL
ncbi:MAG: fluoride efflux transporter CrcB [Candidatus Omnitrophica bacterium]|nr:fluoride efflux transporter CrcB [Candidatus Omnitrophota bacterium]